MNAAAATSGTHCTAPRGGERWNCDEIPLRNHRPIRTAVRALVVPLVLPRCGRGSSRRPATADDVQHPLLQGGRERHRVVDERLSHVAAEGGQQLVGRLLDLGPALGVVGDRERGGERVLDHELRSKSGERKCIQGI